MRRKSNTANSLAVDSASAGSIFCRAAEVSASLLGKTVVSINQSTQPIMSKLTIEKLQKARDILTEMTLTTAPINVVRSAAMIEQFRFPSTKKRRIRNKWRKRRENWRPMRTAVAGYGMVIVHPEYFQEFMEKMEVPNV